MNWPDYRSKWEISEEQMEIAKERFEQRKAETMEYCSKKGVLTWHAMGMDYKPTIKGGIGNYRIRTTFKDKTGHVWLIEIHPVRNDKANADEARGAWGEVYDVSRNDREMKEYNDRFDILLLLKQGGFSGG